MKKPSPTQKAKSRIDKLKWQVEILTQRLFELENRVHVIEAESEVELQQEVS